VPNRPVELSFAVSGRVAMVAVVRGDEVGPGDVLATLESDLLQAHLSHAEAALLLAQAQLDCVKAGPRPQEVAIARAQLEAAEGALAEAEAQHDQPDVGATKAEVAAAQAQVATAMADRLVSREHHENTMKCVDVNMPGGGERTICPLLGPTEEQARYRWHAAEEGLDAAQAQLDALLAAGDAEVRAVQAGVSKAAAQRDAARAELDALQAGPTAEETAAAEARVAQARAGVQAARVALDQATLRAPSGGAVAAVETSPGEAVTPGQVVLTLADLRHLRVETTDLRERDVDRVAVGQRATVYVEALYASIEGHVVDIAPRANTVGGDVVFVVTIALDDQPPGLRWGMSVEVEIATE
jgi:multidrug resistance efflux pump